MSEISYNENMLETLELVVKYGLPLVISVLCIWGIADLYIELKKKWVPTFLISFKDLSLGVRGLNDSLQDLTKKVAEQAPRIEKIQEDVDIIKDKLAEIK
jgi:hypothetical protein